MESKHKAKGKMMCKMHGRHGTMGITDGWGMEVESMRGPAKEEYENKTHARQQEKQT
jgi:hypothetical protein